MHDAEESQTGDPGNVSNAIEQSADFSKFDFEFSNDDVIRYIPKRINKPKNDSQSLDRSNELSAISPATSQERSSREKIWEGSGQVLYLGIFFRGKQFGMLSSKENVTGKTNINHESDRFCCFMICINLCFYMYMLIRYVYI